MDNLLQQINDIANLGGEIEGDGILLRDEYLYRGFKLTAGALEGRTANNIWLTRFKGFAKAGGIYLETDFKDNARECMKELIENIDKLLAQITFRKVYG